MFECYVNVLSMFFDIYSEFVYEFIMKLYLILYPKNFYKVHVLYRL